MKKLLIILAITAVMAFLAGCTDQDKSDTVKAASSSAAAASSQQSQTGASPDSTQSALPAPSPSPGDTTAPSKSSGASAENSKKLDKEIGELKDELKYLKDLFGDINFDGMDEF